MSRGFYFMASLRILLKQKKERCFRHGVIVFFESLSMHLVAGLEMAYAWEQALSSLHATIPQELQQLLQKKGGEGMGEVFQRLSLQYPTVQHRLWFSVLNELYQSGAGMVEIVRSLAHTLRDEQSRDLETHLRNLPVKMNVVLILFFFPPTILLIFAPLLLELTHLF